MRILVHGLVGDNLGGIETFLLNMNDFMSGDCIFDYVVEEDKCMHMKKIRRRGGNVYRVRSRVKHPIGNAIDIVRLYNKHKNEYSVIYFNLSSLSWILPEVVGKLMGFRIVVHAHNAMLIDANSRFVHRNMNRLNKWLLAHMNVRRLTCSQYASEFMFGNRKSTIIYNGIDAKKYQFSEKKRVEIRKKYGIDENAFVIGTVGRLAYQKNPLFTIDIFNWVLKKNPNSKLLMFGDGNLRTEIFAKVKKLGITEHVIMPGIVEHIHEVLSAMDIFLFPSRHEGLGIALIEAQANGLPCYTSKDVVPKEVEVTDLVTYCRLDEPCRNWSDKILTRNLSGDRCSYNQKVRESAFNIRREALKLERILKDEV